MGLLWGGCTVVWFGRRVVGVVVEPVLCAVVVVGAPRVVVVVGKEGGVVKHVLVRRGAAIEAVSTPACDQTAGAGLVGSCPGKVGRGGAVGPVWRELGLSAAVVGSGQDHRGMHSRAVLELEQHPCRGTLDHGSALASL